MSAANKRAVSKMGGMYNRVRVCLDVSRRFMLNTTSYEIAWEEISKRRLRCVALTRLFIFYDARVTHQPHHLGLSHWLAVKQSSDTTSRLIRF